VHNCIRQCKTQGGRIYENASIDETERSEVEQGAYDHCRFGIRNSLRPSEDGIFESIIHEPCCLTRDGSQREIIYRRGVSHSACSKKRRLAGKKINKQHKEAKISPRKCQRMIAKLVRKALAIVDSRITAIYYLLSAYTVSLID
jgi:hypothetical protein